MRFSVQIRGFRPLSCRLKGDGTIGSLLTEHTLRCDVFERQLTAMSIVGPRSWPKNERLANLNRHVGERDKRISPDLGSKQLKVN